MSSRRVFVRDDGFRYEGDWNDGITGLGRGQFADGSLYEGEWKNGLPHGLGVFFSATSGSKFSGHWNEERLEGSAVMVNRTNGHQYEGEYREGKSHGYGVLTFTSTGEKYAGEWIRDSYDGLGIFHSADGKQEGRWTNDVFASADDATVASQRADLAAMTARRAAEEAERMSSRALDVAELARNDQAKLDGDELEEAKREGRAYYALFKYEARSTDEIDLEESDVIVDAEAVDEMWFRGRNQRTGKSGLIPLEYAARVVDDV